MKREPPADIDRRGGEGGEGEAAGPAERGEGAQESLVRVLREDVGEPQRPEAERALEQQRNGAQLVAEPAFHAGVVVLHQRSALEQHVAHLRDHQRERDERDIRATVQRPMRDDAPPFCRSAQR